MLNLKTILQGLPGSTLRGLEARLGLDAQSPAWKIDSPVDRILWAQGSLKTLKEKTQALSSSETRLLSYILSQSGRVTDEELRFHFVNTDRDLFTLQNHGLLFKDPFIEHQYGLLAWVVPEELIQVFPLRFDELTTLAFLLDQLSPDQVGTIAHTYRIMGKGKWLQIVELKRKILHKDYLKQVISHLPKDEHRLFSKALHQEGILLPEDFSKSNYDQEQIWVKNLQERALLFQTGAGKAVIPSDIYILLASPSGRSKAKAGSQPLEIKTWGFRLFQDLRLALAYDRSGRKKKPRDFLHALGLPTEENYFAFLKMLSDELAKRNDAGQADHLDLIHTQTLKQLTDLFLHTNVWQESAEERLMENSSEQASDELIVSKRRLILESLNHFPVLQWIPMEDFLQVLLKEGWRKMELFGNRRLVISEAKQWRDATAGPNLGSQATLENVLNESFLWMGLVDVGVSPTVKKGTTLTHVRLTQWGRQILEGLIPLENLGECEKQFRLLPDLEIVAPPYLAMPVLEKLFRLADLSGLQSFRLSKKSFQEAFHLGENPETIRAFLREHSLTEIPSLIDDWLGELSQRQGQIEMGHVGLYIEVKDPLLLVELKAQPAFAKLIRKELSDRVVILLDTDVERVSKLLKKLGYPPHIVS